MKKILLLECKSLNRVFEQKKNKIADFPIPKNNNRRKTPAVLCIFDLIEQDTHNVSRINIRWQV